MTPRPAEPKKFPPPDVDKVVRPEAPEGVPARQGACVQVAIFDTWPARERPRTAPEGVPIADPFGEIRAFRDGLPAAAPARPRLDDAVAGRIVPANRMWDYIDASIADMCSHPVGRGGESLPEYPPPGIPDHGLFIADIISDIAPRADISVYRVLNTYGIGTMESLGRAVESAIARAAGAPLVLNFSFGFGPELVEMNDPVTGRPTDSVTALLRNAAWVYTNSRQWLRLLAEARPRGRALPAGRAAEARIRDQELSFAALQHLTDAFSMRNVLAVAAAGNNSDRRNGLIVAPRMPAAVEGVLGVSAVTPDGAGGWTLSGYSNDDDILAPDDGVSAFGGESGGGPDDTDTRQGLVALYITKNLDGGATNGHGLAEWAGTSFATPIVSAVAACYWSEHPALAAVDVLHFIVGSAIPWSPAAPRFAIDLQQV